MLIGNTSEPTIDFQGTFIRFSDLHRRGAKIQSLTKKMSRPFQHSNWGHLYTSIAVNLGKLPNGTSI